MKDHFFNQKTFYYFVFQLIFSLMVMFLTSLGAFFHFLLDHEISIVESWLHNNHWEMIIVSKGLAFFLIYKWFDIQLYQFKKVFIRFKSSFKRPDSKAFVISIFMVFGYLAVARFEFNPQNLAYWSNHLISFLGILVFFFLDYLFLSTLDEIFGKNRSSRDYSFLFCVLVIFIAAYKLSIPDYYYQMPHIFGCFAMTLLLSGEDFKGGSNVVIFLLVFVAPLAAFFGLDPVWGEDFSIFKLSSRINLSFLVVIWMISFTYYKYRDVLISYSRKFIR